MPSDMRRCVSPVRRSVAQWRSVNHLTGPPAGWAHQVASLPLAKCQESVKESRNPYGCSPESCRRAARRNNLPTIPNGVMGLRGRALCKAQEDAQSSLQRPPRAL